VVVKAPISVAFKAAKLVAASAASCVAASPRIWEPVRVPICRVVSAASWLMLS